jgi:hypothetical protein
MYNYFLGGKDHYPADREAAEKVIAVSPEVLIFALQNRAFLRRAIRYLATECGIRQFLDIGARLPTEGNVHEIAQNLDPKAHIVYVDNDPVVLAHGRDMLLRQDDQHRPAWCGDRRGAPTRILASKTTQGEATCTLS